MDKYTLLYVLEKVKAACSREYGVFHTTVGTEDHEACIQLYNDHIIIKCSEDTTYFMWGASLTKGIKWQTQHDRTRSNGI